MTDGPDHQQSAATYQAFKQGVTDRNKQAHSDGKQRRQAFDDLRAKLRREANAEMDRPKR